MPRSSSVASSVTLLLVTASCIPPGLVGGGAGGSSGGSPGQKQSSVSESGPGPQAALDYARNASDSTCAPSCYKPEPTDAMAPNVKGCGYTLWLARERKIGNDTWTKIAVGQYAFADGGATAYPCDQFPAPQSEWKKELADARGQINTFGAKDVAIVDPNTTDWTFETNRRAAARSRRR